MSVSLSNADTIVAQATAPGRGSVGIVRVSGPLVPAVEELVIKKCLVTRQATYTDFYAEDGNVIDQGLAIRFNAPHSFTGEHVLELQGHGGQVVMDMLISACLSVKGIRLAKPGEFSEQAFLNDKLDLTQAEAIADLIDASSQQAAKSALRALQGHFSHLIHDLDEKIIQLRMYVEAAIDFPEEEIDFLADGKIANDLTTINQQFSNIMAQTKQGSLLREGIQVVIAGRPNAGKSSLLNALAGRESAIVTDIAGTTRDVLKEHIQINGMPLHIIDTAGLRESEDRVEQIGVARAWEAINNADRVLFVVDSTDTDAIDPFDIWPSFMQKLPASLPITVIRNKIDLSQEPVALRTVNTAHGAIAVLSIAAKHGDGIELLRKHLADSVGLDTTNEGQFIARRRHLDALEKAHQHLNDGVVQLEQFMAGELLAEELRLCHQALAEITGEFTSDDLLGKIFSSFCIGK